MNRIEEWLKRLPLPKFMPGDVVYIDNGKPEKRKVAYITAYYETDTAEYEYTLENDDEDHCYRVEKDIFDKKEDALKCLSSDIKMFGTVVLTAKQRELKQDIEQLNKTLAAVPAELKRAEVRLKEVEALLAEIEKESKDEHHNEV